MRWSRRGPRRTDRTAPAAQRSVVRSYSVLAVLESLIYGSFSVASLPFAYIGVSDLLYYQAHPDMLAARDAGPEVLGVLGGAAVMAMGLFVAGGAGLCVMVIGPDR